MPIGRDAFQQAMRRSARTPQLLSCPDRPRTAPLTRTALKAVLLQDHPVLIVRAGEVQLLSRRTALELLSELL
ncbi:hypothetical protein [Deinococcus ruber]|uniref:hypothetical protein n=1 Tax=Deinococcus ruber TaxID=1848197 RepID=UPI001668AF71|nr:hypothetical protein [Deinococcus ruber]